MCKVCGKPAVTTLDGVPLCLEHYSRKLGISADDALVMLQRDSEKLTVPSHEYGGEGLGATTDAAHLDP